MDQSWLIRKARFQYVLLCDGEGQIPCTLNKLFV